MADMDELLTIGGFARLAGLTIGALRHHDELDLLRPSRVDPETGYRSYRPEQLETARVISRLRDLEVPLPLGELETCDVARAARFSRPTTPASGAGGSKSTGSVSRRGPTASSESFTRWASWPAERRPSCPPRPPRRS